MSLSVETNKPEAPTPYSKIDPIAFMPWSRGTHLVAGDEAHVAQSPSRVLRRVVGGYKPEQVAGLAIESVAGGLTQHEFFQTTPARAKMDGNEHKRNEVKTT